MNEIPTIKINKKVINMVQATVEVIIKTKPEDHDMMMTTASQVLNMGTNEILLSKKKTISRTSHGWKLSAIYYCMQQYIAQVH